MHLTLHLGFAIDVMGPRWCLHGELHEGLPSLSVCFVVLLVGLHFTPSPHIICLQKCFAAAEMGLKFVALGTSVHSSLRAEC